MNFLVYTYEIMIVYFELNQLFLEAIFTTAIT